jgi:O-acetyl-ADP-ribose deacetylase (regulator of RNase III)
MTTKLTTGDLLEQRVDAVVNTVNTVGVMGKGMNRRGISRCSAA